eukprot:maker-scaffold3299_size9292-snap-gene-0.6 protein:Tk01692 transcript:maker-scaffold3299_size9292-snap-gene-0.6-mRNA-1 annotation:"proteasome subunit alpha"
MSRLLETTLRGPLSRFRNQYDSDVTTWSPQGRLHQVEYAMEAVKQGSATVGLKNATHAVLVAFKRRPSELAAHQKKILTIDDHVGVSFAGLTADAKSLGRWMRTECLHARYYHNAPLALSHLSTDLGNKMQLCIQGYNKRPYGVGMLMAGYDHEGPCIIQICPSANFYPCRAMAIGARSQSARTYLEKNLDQFQDCDLEELVKHGLRALRDTLPNEVDLTKENVSIAIVGQDLDFIVHEDDAAVHYLSGIEGEERRGAAAAPTEDKPAPAAAAGGETMETE